MECKAPGSSTAACSRHSRSRTSLSLCTPRAVGEWSRAHAHAQQRQHVRGHSTASAACAYGAADIRAKSAASVLDHAGRSGGCSVDACGRRAAASGMDAPACARGVWQWRRECPLPSHPCHPYHPCQPLPTPATPTIPCQPLSPLPTPATPANPCQHLSPLPHPAPYTHTLALTVISQVGTRFLPCSPNGRVFASSILSRSFLVKRAF